jgi:hypothetical protein
MTIPPGRKALTRDALVDAVEALGGAAHVVPGQDVRAELARRGYGLDIRPNGRVDNWATAHVEQLELCSDAPRIVKWRRRLGRRTTGFSLTDAPVDSKQWVSLREAEPTGRGKPSPKARKPT